MTETELQELLDAAPEGGVVDVPAGEIALTRPLRLRTNGIRLRGQGKFRTTLRMWRAGPWVVAAPDYPAFPTVATTVGGCAAALSLTGDVNVWVNLRKGGACELNGLAAFCLECWWTPGVTDTSHRNIVSSYGKLHTGDSAFEVLQIDDKVRLMLNVGGVDRILTTPTLTPGQRYHLALTYDGNAVRLFVDGVLAASVSATGLLVQRAHEDVMIGPQTGQWPELTFGKAPAVGTLAGLTLWKQPRYVAAFTPPTAVTTPTSQTLIQVTGETDDLFLVCRRDNLPGQSIGEPVWCATRRNGVGLVDGVQIEDVCTVGPAEFMHVYNARVRRVRAHFTWQGWLFLHDCFCNVFDDCEWLAREPGSQYCLQIAVGGVNGFAGQNQFIGGTYTIGSHAGSSGGPGFTGLMVIPTWSTVFALVLRGYSGGNSGFLVSNFLLDDESHMQAGQTRQLRALVFLDGVTATFSGGLLEYVTAPAGAAPNVLIRDCDGVAFNAMVFANASGGPVVEFMESPRTVSIRDSHRRTAGLAWASPEQAGYIAAENSGT